MVIFDADGVLTDGNLYLNDHKEAFKPFNVKDGLGIAFLKFYKFKVCMISGKESTHLLERCKALNFDAMRLGITDKVAAMGELADLFNLSLEEILFVGDDVIDLMSMESCGFSIAPKDAHSLVLDSADHICNSKGGAGVAREVADLLVPESTGKSLRELYLTFLNQPKTNDSSLISQ
ncbi:KdsC family phosphatase [Vibrio barjaei]|uniref:KdsC family phosphatase n=1 Tax=Vibrio barjaei TaxID=1676683 RepID=UPI002284D2DD|nr:HAD hydrolase family protein [Vibrio barjaei]MCY9872346.1 HAD hydrolase family protein [Vibrio barjaei]